MWLAFSVTTNGKYFQVHDMHVRIFIKLRLRLFQCKTFSRKSFPYFPVFGTTENLGQTENIFTLKQAERKCIKTIISTDQIFI